MAEIGYKAFDQYLASPDKVESVPVYLIYGDEYLYQSAYKLLVDKLLPGSRKQHNLEQDDGGGEYAHDLLESLNTFSFFSGLKVIAFCDSRIFYSKQGDAKYLEKARSAFEKDEKKKAVRSLTALLSRLGLAWEDIDKTNRQKTLKQVIGDSEDDRWLDELIVYGLENNIAIPPKQDLAAMLQNAIEKGFPKKNRLVITCDAVDKRKSLYKLIKEKGTIVDCSVPKGSRQADRKIQQELVDEIVRTVLSRSSKHIDPGALRMLMEMTGFELRGIAANLEKLVSYVGTRPKISPPDVQAVLKRTKEDPIYELTGAIAERRYENALFYLNSLLSNNFHPLQALAALINQIRKLLLAKDFVESQFGRNWMSGMPFPQFKSSVMPAITEYDNFLKAETDGWALTQVGDDGGGKKKGKRKKNDLVLAPNPNSPYPVYQTLLKSDLFNKEELVTALLNLQHTDVKLKSSGQNPKLILENVILKICLKSRGK